MNTTTTIDLDRLEALAKAATPGPWAWWTSNSTLRLTGADGKDGSVLYAYGHSGNSDVCCSPENKAFIAAANPAAILELIAAHRAALAAKGQQEPVAWISVKDRLPEPWDGKRFSKSVLIVDMDSSYPHVRMSELNFDDEGPTVWSGADPTHWRPAPALPGSLTAPVAQQSEAGALTKARIKELLAHHRTYNSFDMDEWPLLFADALLSEAGAPTAATLILAQVRALAEKWNADAVADGFAMSEPAGELLDLLDAAPTSGREGAAPLAEQDAPAFDPVVEANRKLLLERSHVGMKKYGTTLAAAGLSRAQLAQHALEEALDLANYLQTIIQTEEAQHG